MKQAAIIGASGAIGRALALQLLESAYRVHAFSRSDAGLDSPDAIQRHIDIEDEHTIEQAAAALDDGTLDIVIVATGMLHDGEMMPEKSMRELSADKFQQLFAVNTIGPALVGKHFVPKLKKKERAVFAAISARVGSISDNYLGGWYSYRASKAALNMVLKNMAIEVGRRHKNVVVLGLHPGTVDSALSDPFQKNVPEEKLFSPEQSADYLMDVLAAHTPEDSGKCFAWDGQEIKP